MDAAKRGWFVFPTRPGSKEPRRGLAWPRAATGDPARLARATWRAGEGYGIAAKPSGLVIIDLDQPKPGYELPPEWRDEPGIVDGRDVLVALAERSGVASWPHTFTVATPSGGQHLYYIAPAGRVIGNKPLGPLIDVRGGGYGNGGYVIGPGSVIGGKAYEIADDREPAPLPVWIADLLDPPPAPPVACGPASGAVYGRLRGVVEHLLSVGPGEGQQRNNRLYWAACRAAEMIAAGEIEAATAERVLYRAAEENGYVASHGERATLATIASGMRLVR